MAGVGKERKERERGIVRGKVYVRPSPSELVLHLVLFSVHCEHGIVYKIFLCIFIELFVRTTHFLSVIISLFEENQHGGRK